VKKGWLIGGSVIFAGISAAAWARIGSPDTATAVGTYAGAVISGLAFLWLVAGFWVQAEELKLQRDELALQRRAVEQQGRDTRELARLGALEQVASMFSGFNASIPGRGINQCDTIHDVPRQLVPRMALFRTILTAPDASARYHAYLDWSTMEGLAVQLMGCAATAIRLLAPYTPELTETGDLTNEDLIIRNEGPLQRLPHVQSYALSIIMTARLFSTSGDLVLAVRVAGLEASQAVLGDVIRNEELDRLRAELAARRGQARG
jgi:hypothetical protein